MPIPSSIARRMIVLLLYLLVSVAAYSLISGASWLGESILGLLPLGNLLAWFGLLALPTAVWLAAGPGSRLWQAARLLWCLALPWLAVSALLAGNLTLVFNAGAQWQFQLWLLYSSVSVCSGVLLVICCWITEIRQTAGFKACTTRVSKPVNRKITPDTVG